MDYNIDNLMQIPSGKNYFKVIKENNELLKAIVPVLKQQGELLHTVIKQNQELIDELTILKKPSNN